MSDDKGDVLQRVQDALLLHSSTAADEPTILTIDPSAWTGQHQFIDISRILHIMPQATRASGVDLERGVARFFLEAGWPAERIAKEYRPDLKSRDIIDVALLGADGQCLVAVEVKLNVGPHWVRRVRDARVHLQDVVPNVAWHCITEGTTYYLRNTTTDQSFEIQGAFAPEALATGDFTTGRNAHPCVPDSFERLAAMLVGASWVVLDHIKGGSRQCIIVQATEPVGRFEFEQSE